MKEKRVVYIHNFSGHAFSPAVLNACRYINHELRKLSKNATYLTQPADSFLIAKIKAALTNRWEYYKSEMIGTGQRRGGTEGSSGKLRNTGKLFFLKLAADSVRDFNSVSDKYGLSYARKAMIRTGMSLNLNRKWEESQVSLVLLAIIAKHRNHYEEQAVH